MHRAAAIAAVELIDLLHQCLAPLLLSGGGLKSGQVIGQSTRDAGEPATEPVTIPNLVSTIMHTLLDVGQVRTMTNVPADVARVITGPEPIRELMNS